MQYGFFAGCMSLEGNFSIIFLHHFEQPAHNLQRRTLTSGFADVDTDVGRA
jgi:hypothetical protein